MNLYQHMSVHFSYEPISPERFVFQATADISSFIDVQASRAPDKAQIIGSSITRAIYKFHAGEKRQRRG